MSLNGHILYCINGSCIVLLYFFKDDKYIRCTFYTAIVRESYMNGYCCVEGLPLNEGKILGKSFVRQIKREKKNRKKSLFHLRRVFSSICCFSQSWAILNLKSRFKNLQAFCRWSNAGYCLVWEVYHLILTNFVEHWLYLG